VDLPDASGNGTPGGHSHPTGSGRTQQATGPKLFFTAPLAFKDVQHHPPTPHGFGWPSNFLEQVPGPVSVDMATDTAVGSEAEAFPSSASDVGQAMTAEKGVEDLQVSVASSSTTAAVGSTAWEKESCENSRLAALETRCLHLEQNLAASEMEKERLTSRLRHLGENAARVTKALQRKEEQVGELNLQSTKLARALMEVTAGTITAAAPSGSGSPYPMPQDARVFEGAELLQSPDDEEEHLGNVSTLAALRERLYREYDAKVNGGLASSSGGGADAPASPPGSPNCCEEAPPTSPPLSAPAPSLALPMQTPPIAAVQNPAQHRRLGTRSAAGDSAAGSPH